MKKCFVIMPYGGQDPEKQRHYAGVYQSIISPAIRSAGYEPKRSDIAGEPGNITHDIVRDLAESEMVIADLTSANPNVFFELGIRHAFRKSGTVHIVDSSHQIPFDVRQYRAIEYSTDLADIPEAADSIAGAIKKRELQPERPDNPVHDAIPQLPIDITATGDEALQLQLQKVQEKMEELHDENEKLESRILEIDPSHGARRESEIDVDQLLDRADEIMKKSGEHALLRLRQVVEESGPDGFARELREVLRSPYLDQNDFMAIVILCKEAGLAEHRLATLEVARRRYPNNSHIFIAFIDALDDSPNPAERERGRLILEERMGIQHEEETPVFRGKPVNLPLRDAFGLLFNLYRKEARFAWIIALTESPKEPLASDSMIVRNRADALSKSGRTEEAEEEYNRALRLDPTDDQTLAWFADFLDDQGKFAEAYSTFEKAIEADPEDPRLFLSLGIHMMNRGYYRAEDGEIRGPAPRRARPRYVVPLLLQAIKK